MKRGLVLEGGGAKGAYQMGCLLAFEERKIRFDVIAGTSVGALNGALLSSGKIGKGAQYWRSLSFRHAVSPRWRFAPVSLLLLLYVASYYYNRRGYSPPLTIRNVKIMLVYIVVISGVICISEGLVPTLQYAVLMFFLFVVPWFAYSFLRAIRFSVFTPSPLAEFLDEVVATGQDLRKPLYVTLSDYQLGFDPDKPRLFYGKDFDKVIWAAVEDEYEYPNYFKVNDLSLGEQKDLLLGSAALPLGIFPPIHMGPREYVDGGVADNLPLYPLVSLEKCDELFVIPLRPTRVDSLKSHWQEIDRRLRQRKISVDQGKELYYSELDKREGDYKHAPHYEPPVNLPLRQPETWPTRIVIISPRRQLGTFLTGTMNFRSRYTKRLMKQGYRDALTAIEEQLFFSTD